MAVYKPTMCYPFLNNLDIRVVPDNNNLSPAEWLKCKIDSSNKQITGYRVRILDENNEEIFKGEEISPISELYNLNLGDDINTGYNGTYLNIPFFQNINLWNTNSQKQEDYIGKKLDSFNAIYFSCKFKADYYIDKDEANEWTLGKYNNIENGCLYKKGWDGILNGELVSLNDVIYVYTDDTSSSSKNGLWKVIDSGILIPYTIKNQKCNISNEQVLIMKGRYHNEVYNNGKKEVYEWKQLTTDTSTYSSGYKSINFNLDQGSYKWVVDLYQGKADFAEDASSITHYQSIITNLGAYYINYENISNDWYDMVLTTGKILGSNPQRLQIADENDNLPKGSETDPLVLEGKYMELLDNSGNKLGSRINVKTYDSTLGHVYPPFDSAIDSSTLEATTDVCFYKYSNDPSYILPGDIVQVASNSNDTNQNSQKYSTVTVYESGNVKGLFSNPVYDDSTQTTRVDTYIPSSNAPTTQGTKYVINLSNEGALPSNSDIKPEIGTSYTIIWNQIDTTNNQIIYYLVTDPSGPADGKLLADRATFDTNKKYLFINENSSYRYQTFEKLEGQGKFTLCSDNVAPGLFTMGDYLINEGDYVLLKDQTDKKENGIFVAHAAGSNNTRWTRAGSYATWGDFIGKIIYVSAGSESGNNFQSLATAGGNLYRANNLTSNNGSSRLLFTKEKPIVIYPSKIDYTVAATSNVRPQEITPATDPQRYTLNKFQDNYNLQTGDQFFDNNESKIYKVITGGDTDNVQLVLVTTVNTSENKHIFVTNGQDYGQATLVFKKNAWEKNDLIFRTAKVLKNTTTQTYISPYLLLEKNMSLKLLNNKNFSFNSDSVSPYLKINEINKNVWRISHEELKEALSSIDPYSYEIRTFFKTSDENPFYTYEFPYLKLGNSSEGYTNIWTYTSYDVANDKSETFTPYDVYYRSVKNYGTSLPNSGNYKNDDRFLLTQDNTPNLKGIYKFKITQNFGDWTKVKDNESGYTPQNYYYVLDKKEIVDGVGNKIINPSELSNFIIPYLIKQNPLSFITNRYITLQGFYYQYQQLSWESYRWILTDKDGNLVQDTGKKYDKKMEVSFYGLSNNTEDNQNIYYAILYVEDSVGNLLTYSVRLIVNPTQKGLAGIPFKAEFDCSTHSNILRLLDRLSTYPSISKSDSSSDDTYVNNNPTLQWDGSIEYNKGINNYYAKITGKNGVETIPIPDIYSSNQTLPTYSNTETYGLEYKHFYTDMQYKTPKEENLLSFSGEGAYISTEIAPVNNFWGDLFKIKVDNPDNIVKNFELSTSIPTSFINETFYGNNLDAQQNIIKVKVVQTLETDKNYYLIRYTGLLTGINSLTNFNMEESCIKQYYKFSVRNAVPSGSILELNLSDPTIEKIILNTGTSGSVTDYFNKVSTNNYLQSISYAQGENSGIIINGLNPYRNKILFNLNLTNINEKNMTGNIDDSSTSKIAKINGIIKSGESQFLEWFNYENNDKKFILQNRSLKINDLTSTNYEFLNFNIDGYSLWYKKGSSDDTVLNSEYDLGRLCLITAEDSYSDYNPIYWLEDNGVIKKVNSNYILNGTHNINLCQNSSPISTSNSQYWPEAGTEEESSYWREGNFEAPGVWTAITDQISILYEDGDGGKIKSQDPAVLPNKTYYIKIGDNSYTPLSVSDFYKYDINSNQLIQETNINSEENYYIRTGSEGSYIYYPIYPISRWQGMKHVYNSEYTNKRQSFDIRIPMADNIQSYINNDLYIIKERYINDHITDIYEVINNQSLFTIETNFINNNNN